MRPFNSSSYLLKSRRTALNSEREMACSVIMLAARMAFTRPQHALLKQNSVASSQDTEDSSLLLLHMHMCIE